MKREKIDFTDNELYYIALALQSHINSRDFYVTRGSSRILKNAMQKVIDNGMKRKSKEKILHPLVNFED